MIVEINVRAYQAVAVIVAVILVAGIGAATAQVSHPFSELAGQGYCLISVTKDSCPSGFTRDTVHLNRYLRVATSTGMGGNSAHTHHYRTPPVNGLQFTHSSGSHALDDAYNLVWEGDTDSTSVNPEYVTITVCCKS